MYVRIIIFVWHAWWLFFYVIHGMVLTPLTAGCRIGYYDVVKIILQNGASVNHQHVVGFDISMPKDVYYYVIYWCNWYRRKHNGLPCLRPVHGKTWAYFVKCFGSFHRHMRKIGCHAELTDEEGNTTRDFIQENIVQLVYYLSLLPWHPDHVLFPPR